MLEAFYATERGSLEDATINGGFDLHTDLVWIDLIAPSQEEQQWVLDAYDQNLPTLKSLEDISSSARFYRDDDGILHISTYFLTKKMFSSYRFIFFKAFFYSILVQVLQVICFIFILLSFNVTNNFSIYSVIFLASSILSLISFAGIGIREMLFLQASKWFGFQSEIAVSASLIFTIITAFFSLFGVIFQIRKLNLKLSIL